jgi:hypothetical protein
MDSRALLLAVLRLPVLLRLNTCEGHIANITSCSHQDKLHLCSCRCTADLAADQIGARTEGSCVEPHDGWSPDVGRPSITLKLSQSDPHKTLLHTA